MNKLDSSIFNAILGVCSHTISASIVPVVPMSAPSGNLYFIDSYSPMKLYAQYVLNLYNILKKDSHILISELYRKKTMSSKYITTMKKQNKTRYPQINI